MEAKSLVPIVSGRAARALEPPRNLSGKSWSTARGKRLCWDFHLAKGCDLAKPGQACPKGITLVRRARLPEAAFLDSAFLTSAVASMRAGACAALSGTSVSWTVCGLATHFGDLFRFWSLECLFKAAGPTEVLALIILVSSMLLLSFALT